MVDWGVIPMQIIISFFGFSTMTSAFFKCKNPPITIFRWLKIPRKFILIFSSIVCIILWASIAIKTGSLVNCWDRDIYIWSFFSAWSFSIVPVVCFWIDLGTPLPERE